MDMTAGVGSAAPYDRETFGAQVVAKTIDYMNTTPNGSLDSDYDFQKSVLSAAFTPSGDIIDLYA